MHYATKRGNVRVVEYLVDHHAELDAVDADNKQPLHYACETRNLKLIKLLISLGAKLNEKGGWVSKTNGVSHSFIYWCVLFRKELSHYCMRAKRVLLM
jgi:ankyrin repeat protein